MFEPTSPSQGRRLRGVQMETSAPTTFRHRHSRDGTWDSICTKCYLTVETALLEEELAGAERSHDCVKLLAFRMGLKPPLSEPVEDTHDLQVTDKVGTHD
jgi:hypothetical protein